MATSKSSAYGDDMDPSVADTLKKLGISPKNVNNYTPRLWLPTGVPELDINLGEHGGCPSGSVIEIAGPSGGGKTLLAYNIIAQAQQQFGWGCVFLNAENGFYPPRAQQVGVSLDPDKLLLLSNLGAGEDYAQTMLKLVELGRHKVFVLDSITSLIPAVEFGKDMHAVAKMSSHAVFVGRFMRDLSQVVGATDTFAYLVNQTRMAKAYEGQNAPMTERSTGGKSIEFYTQVRMWVRRDLSKDGKIVGKDADGKPKVIGGKSTIKIVKNRFSGPVEKPAVMKVYFGEAEGDPVTEFLYRLKAKELIRNAYGSYSYPDIYGEKKEGTGEIHVKSKDPYDFIEQLYTATVPTKLLQAQLSSKSRTKDTSKNAFEYLCNQLRLTPNQVQDIQTAIEKRGEEPVMSSPSPDNDMDYTEFLEEGEPVEDTEE